MARKYELITGLYEQTIREVSSRPASWTAFLRSACRNYRLPFDELLLIYAQRPDATAVLPIEGEEGWNKRFGRWVNRGATGIAVFDRQYTNGTRLKYYFDISDTHASRFARPVPLWEARPEYEADIIEALENRFGGLENREDLVAALFSVARNAVEDNITDYLADLLISREGSFLEELDERNVEVIYRNVLQSSVAYMFLTRCGINADEYIAVEDFLELPSFNTPSTINAVGVATRDIAEVGLSEIARTVRSLQRPGKNQNHTFAEKTAVRYPENTERSRQPERSFENGTDLHHAGGLPPAEPDRTGGTGSSLWKIRPAASVVPEGTPHHPVYESADFGQADRPSAGDRGSGAEPYGTDFQRKDEGGGRDGGTESPQPDGMGAENEPDPGFGGGNHPQGTDLQLTFFPTVEEQQNRIEEAEAGKASAFVISQEDIDAVLQDGSGIQNGKYRIYEQFQKSLSQDENAKFLKAEYGWGGAYPKISARSLDESHDGKGITISRGRISAPDASVTLSWNKAAKRIAELIRLDRYLNSKEKAGYPTYLQQAEERRQRASEAAAAREILSRAPLEAEPAKKKGTRYAYHLGDTVYLGAAEYEILAFDENEVRLFDVNFPLFTKEMPRTEFDEKVRANPMNDHLIVPVESGQPELEEDKRLINGYSAEEQDENRQLADTHIEEMLRQAEQMTRENEVPPYERFSLLTTDNGYAVWDDLREEIYVEENGVSKAFTSEWQAQAYLEEIKKTVSDKQAAEWLAIEQAKLPPLEYAAGGHIRERQPVDLEQSYAYRLLDRLRSDCDYYLGAGGRSEKHLWAGSTEKQIAKMRELYALLPEKPEWLSEQDIDHYEQQMTESPQKEAGEVFTTVTQPNKRVQVSKSEFERLKEKLDEGGIPYAASPSNGNIEISFSSEQEASVMRLVRQLDDEILGKEIILDGHRFVVDRISDLSSDVTLRDMTFEQNVGIPISRVEKMDTVRRLIQQQEAEKKPVLRSIVIDLTPKQEVSAPLYAADDRFFAPPPVRREKVSPFVLHPEIPTSERHNFRIIDDHLGEGGAKTKFKNNVAAIRTLQEIESDNHQPGSGRLATPEEQEILSRYVGWGGLPQAFDENNEQWADEFAELYTLLSPEEYEAAKATTLNAHYTSPTVIKALYQAVENMGFRTGNILEPSCGIGNFFGLVPESMKGSKLFGVELDSVTGRIARQLYQKNSIAVQGFEETELPDSFFDLAVGNVPFGSYSVHDKRYDKYCFLIHDYFFAKTLDKVRPGGIVAFVTSKGTMDKQNPNVRKYIAERAELIGAIRLPNNAFLANAGTQVTTDILFLQKREKWIDVSMPEVDSGLEWLHLGQTENGVPINQYYIDHPEMVLGEMAFDDRMYGNAKETTCKPFEGETLSEQLAEAVQNIHAEYTDYEIEELDGEEDRSIPADPNVRNFSFTVVDGAIYYRENSRMFPVEQSLTGQNRIKGMMAIRDCTRRLIEYQTEGAPDDILEREQKELNRLYDGFTAKYGLLNSRANSTAFSPDSSFPLLSSLEVLDENGNLERKADMFRKRTIKPYITVSRVDTASEALAVSIGEKACVDLEFMANLMGESEKIEQIKRDLAGLIFKDPDSGDDPLAGWQTADEYLSGRVREKLKRAKLAAEQDPAYALNVEALEKVQPKDLTAGEISVRLGTTWIPEKVIEEFTFWLLETPPYYARQIHIRYSKVTGEWNVSEKSLDRSNIRAYNTYGTKRINAYKIMEDTLNLRDVRIFDTQYDADGRETRVLNKKETAIAQDKQDLIKQKFQEWIWAEPSRRDRICRIYNDKFNSIRPREYDGSHLVFAGMNPEKKLRPHQRNAVARAIYGGNALFGHVVGAGKTYAMIATAMEAKRLGLSSKALFVVPNNIIGDFASDFLELYPSANILMATKKDFEKQNRKRFCARIATGDYDGIIIGHSQFEKIPLSAERQQAMLQKQIAEIVAGIAAAKKEEGARFTVKQMEKSKKNLEAKLKKLNDQSRKDDVVTFEELGVDRLFIDEADLFKNLFLYTKMRNVGGISQTEAFKASDLFMKCRYLDELTGYKGVVFATGTPVSNSLAEMYTMQRYLQYKTLEDMELTHFDSWAAQFGETTCSMELKPEGTGFQQKTRFSNFYNLPELMAMFKEVADIQTADMLDLPVPKVHYETVVCKPSEIQKEMILSYADRADAVRNGSVDPTVDNMLLITNDGRKLALDQRLINPLFPDFEGSKVNVCADNVYRIWEETQKDRLTQLVFCDLSTPGKQKPVEMQENEDGTMAVAAFQNVYDDMRKKLIDRGIPPEEIAFVHEADNETQKKELFAKVRRGKIRVLFGSTSKMGAGTNVQDKLIALHDLDCRATRS